MQVWHPDASQVAQFVGQTLQSEQVVPEIQYPALHTVQMSVGEVMHVRQPVINVEQGLRAQSPFRR